MNKKKYNPDYEHKNNLKNVKRNNLKNIKRINLKFRRLNRAWQVMNEVFYMFLLHT